MKNYVEAKAAAFVRHAPKAYAAQLDYSVSSLEALDQILRRNVWPCKFLRARRERLWLEGSNYLFAVAMLHWGGTVTYWEELKCWFLVVKYDDAWVALGAHNKVLARLSGDAGANIPLHYDKFVGSFQMSVKPGAIIVNV